MKLTIYRGRRGCDQFVWRWRIKGCNGEIVASGEGYKTRQACVKTLCRLLSSSRCLCKQLGALEKARPNKRTK